jgi:serine protease Do
MKSLLGRLRYRRLASTFTILATLSAGILIGSVIAHGVHGQESKQNAKIDTADATPLKIPPAKVISTDFSRIAKEVGPAVVNISTVTLPSQNRNRRGRGFQPLNPQQQGPDNDGGGDDDQGQGPDDFQNFFNHFFGGMPPGMGGQDDGGGKAISLPTTT